MAKPICLKTRMHDWIGGPAPGHKCRGCGKIYGQRQRKAAPAAPAKPAKPAKPAAPAKPAKPAKAASVSVQATPAQAAPAQAAASSDEALRRAWLDPPAETATAEPGEPDEADAEPDGEPDLGEPDDEPKESDEGGSVSELVCFIAPDLVISGEQKLIEWWGHRPNPPDAELLEKFKGALRRWIKSAFPETHLSPLAEAAALGGIVYATMRIGAEAILPVASAPTLVPSPPTVAPTGPVPSIRLCSPLSPPKAPPVDDLGPASDAALDAPAE